MNTMMLSASQKKLLLAIGISIVIFLIHIHLNTEVDQSNSSTYQKSYNLGKKLSNSKLANLLRGKFDPAKLLEFYNSIKAKDVKGAGKYSQNNEDILIVALWEFLGLNRPGYYVEFGTQDGSQINTRLLRESHRWKGLLLDGSNENEKINLHKEFIRHDNILDLFAKYNVPIDLDLFSEDTDYGDFWIVEKVLTKYKPKIVVHEINQQKPPTCVTVQKPDRLIFFDNTSYHGGSVCAFRCLAKKNGYTMVYCEKQGTNCFWIKNDLLEKQFGATADQIQQVFTTEFLFMNNGFMFPAHDPLKKEWVQV